MTAHGRCSFCPAGLGCNNSDHEERCALSVCQGAAAAGQIDAAEAIARWLALEASQLAGTGSERRFRRRAFERARDRALIAVALSAPADGPRTRPMQVA